MSQIDVIQIPLLSDNYAYLIRDQATQTTAVIDPSLAEPCVRILKKRNWKLDTILNTHHHPDHVGGNTALKELYKSKVVCSEYDVRRIPGSDQGVSEGKSFSLGNAKAYVIGIPGHTLGHIAFWFAESSALFCGDTLFSLGCGKLFEGTPEQMWRSLKKLSELPGKTLVYCGHEYTQKNSSFAISLEPENRQLLQKWKHILEKRRQGESTVPSTMAEEVATNPFLRPQSLDIRRRLKLESATDVEVFTELRRRKDNF